MNDEVKLKITVIGVGGAGGNAIDYMMEKGITGVRYIAMNTDREGLDHSKAETKILMGGDSIGGMGALGKPQMGKEAARGSRQAIKEAICGNHLVLIVAGLGGGTGTGAAPVIAEICRNAGVSLTVPIVSMPCSIEGEKRADQARQGLITLQTIIDSAIVISCDHVKCSVEKSVTIAGLYNKVDECLYYATKGITDFLLLPGICREFSDVTDMFSLKGLVIMGTGTAPGVKETVGNAINHLHNQGVDLNDAKGLLFSICFGNTDYQLVDLSEAEDFFSRNAGENPKEILWGDVRYKIDEIRAIIYAIGFPAYPVGSETGHPVENTLPKPHIVARYADIIHHLNSRITEFNKFLESDFACPLISVDNPDTYTDTLRSDLGTHGWPSKAKYGVYIFCMSLEESSENLGFIEKIFAREKFGVCIGYASDCKLGDCMYGLLNPFREADIYRKKIGCNGYTIDAILAVPIKDDSAGCLASALGAFLVAVDVPGGFLFRANSNLEVPGGFLFRGDSHLEGW